MKIGLFGYGKMGRMIEQLALKRDHEIVARIDSPDDRVPYKNLDVAIDFSSPDAAFENISNCFKNGVPVVCGTTGWLSRYDEAVSLCKKEGAAFIYASNFSLGVNLFFQLNETLARLINGVSGYQAEMKEIHHTQKLDAPSGTAITLAEGIINNSAYTAWTSGKVEKDSLPIYSERTGEVPGTHKIKYESAVDSIEIIHTAHNRKGFALGALIAAEWIVGKEGVFNMKDVLDIPKK
ncbi:4-hydroxy-tetrahydrodipicolinate reductase [Robiginitalea sp. IMCC44478]|uniref:4-hydroxy-tetrahydrodipicolinate reductase n=1 Tax=Robiginitalea sp. IMCC44478 TaxID=3459122 RepID=UPI004041ADAA